MTGFKSLLHIPTGLMAVSLLLWAAGCTSDDPNTVGTPLVDGEVDEVLVPLEMVDMEFFTGKNVNNPSLPHQRQEALYMGEQEGAASSLLMNFDFGPGSEVDALPDSIFTTENIVSVDLRLLMLDFYANLTEEGFTKGEKALETVYELYRLDAPFDSTAYPAPEPARDGLDLNTNPIPDISSEPNISIAPVFFLDWVATGGQQGLTVRRGVGSQPGLVGYSARDNKHPASTLADLAEGTRVGPVLKVKFVNPDTTLNFGSYADASTFHQVDQAPADMSDGFFMRSSLRSYPFFRFDMAALPQNVFINRAVLAVTVDTTRSFGNLQSMVVSELPEELYGVQGDTMPLPDLGNWAYLITGMTNLDPTYHAELQFNVTVAVQRMVNDVYEGERGFILTAGETFFPTYNLTAVPSDFFFSQFIMFGTNAAESLRPQLRISYSSVDELTGGGE